MLRVDALRSAPEPDRAEADDLLARDLQSGLASLIVHAAITLVLGLLVAAAPRSRLVELSIDIQSDDEAGGGGDGNELGEVDLAAAWDEAAVTERVESEFAAGATLVDASLTSLVDAVRIDAPPLAIGADGLLGAGSGAGTGGGQGAGQGTGVGAGSGPSSITSIFGLADEGGRIVYVFDRSGSMSTEFTQESEADVATITPLEAAQEELVRSLGELTPGTEFGIVFYNSVPEKFPDPEAARGVSTATPQVVSRAKSYVREIAAHGETRHSAGLNVALELKPDVIFLLTDAEAKDDPTPADVRILARLCRQSGTRVNVIHFCFEEREVTKLRALAGKTGGQFRSVTFRSLLRQHWRPAAGSL